jgi:DnaJ homolog subfamily C member 28
MSGVEDQIRRAMEEGKFSNLRGKGKPLHLDDNPLEDPGWRTAHHMLQSSGYTLPWIETRQEIETALEKARVSLARAWAWRNTALQEKQHPNSVEADWKRALAAFEQEIVVLNKRIFSYNLEVPSEQFQRQMLNVEREVERIIKLQGEDK